MKLVFYKQTDGTKPAGKFISSLPTKLRAKVMRDLDLLEKYGFNLGLPYVRKIQGAKYEKLYEMRTKFASNITRIFYFFETKDGIVILNGYLKKSDKTDKKELDKALKYMNDYLEREIKMSRSFESYASVKKELFKNDKKLKAEYDALAPRYELISKAIDARLKKKMTQADVAKKMGTTKSSISRFESGNYNPSFDFLIRLSDALGKKLKVSMA